MEEGKLLPCPFVDIYGQEKEVLILMKSDNLKKMGLQNPLKDKLLFTCYHSHS